MTPSADHPDQPSVERLFPFVLRTRILVVGRPVLARQRKHLQFLLITSDLSENSQREMLHDFTCPVIQHYTSADLERFFGVRGTKVVGFRRSPLAVSIYRELKQFAVSREPPPPAPTPPVIPPVVPPQSRAVSGSGSSSLLLPEKNVYYLD